MKTTIKHIPIQIPGMVFSLLAGIIIFPGVSSCLQASSPAEDILQLDRPLVVAHRGYPTVAPENTIPAFELGKLAGADLVELDYHVSKDGKAIVIHDKTLDRTTNSIEAWGQEDLAVLDKSATEMGSLDAGSWYAPMFAGVRLPTLEEALDVIQRDGGMTLVERKAGSPEHIVQLLREKALFNEVIVQSFDWEFIKGVRALAPNQVLGAIGPSRYWKGKKLTGEERKLSVNWIDEIVGLDVQLIVWNRSVSPETVEYAHEKGLKVLVYTINDLEKAQDLLRMGVDGIITNNVAIIWKAIALME